MVRPPIQPPEAKQKFLNHSAVVQRDLLPKPLPDVGIVSDEFKANIQAMNEFYTKHQFTGLGPTTLQDLQAETETIYAMLGEDIWKSFFGDQVLESDEALPAQLHAVLAYQARFSASRLVKGAKGDKGEGKGKLEQNHSHY